MFNEKTKLERDILRAADRNPDASNKEIARICNCSASHVGKTLKKYRGGLLGGGNGFL